jgi:hypothetical protein
VAVGVAEGGVGDADVEDRRRRVRPEAFLQQAKLVLPAAERDCLCESPDRCLLVAWRARGSLAV